jgi:hypothetical protein
MKIIPETRRAHSTWYLRYYKSTVASFEHLFDKDITKMFINRLLEVGCPVKIQKDIFTYLTSTMTVIYINKWDCLQLFMYFDFYYGKKV